VTVEEAARRLFGGFKKAIDCLDRIELILIFVAGTAVVSLTAWMLVASIWDGLRSGDWIAICVSTLILGLSCMGMFFSIRRARLPWLVVPLAAAIAWGAFHMMYR
jgi:hypothetical protein